MTYTYMIKVYAYLVKAERRALGSLPEEYQTLVAEYLADEVEEK